MEIKTTIDMLTDKGVSIKTQRYIEEDGVWREDGLPHRATYDNSAIGRKLLLEEVEEPYLSQILAVWGEEPTIIEEPLPEPEPVPDYFGFLDGLMEALADE